MCLFCIQPHRTMRTKCAVVKPQCHLLYFLRRIYSFRTHFYFSLTYWVNDWLTNRWEPTDALGLNVYKRIHRLKKMCELYDSIKNKFTIEKVSPFCLSNIKYDVLVVFSISFYWFSNGVCEQHTLFSKYIWCSTFRVRYYLSWNVNLLFRIANHSFWTMIYANNIKNVVQVTFTANKPLSINQKSCISK